MPAYKITREGLCDSFVTNGGSEVSMTDIAITINGDDAKGSGTYRDYLDYIHINTYTGYTQLVGSPLSISSPMIHVHVDPECDLPVTVECSIDMEIVTIHTYKPNIVDGMDSSYKHPRKMLSGDTSFELLRTNPKLTGNVKLVVDSSSNMYLDTFKTLPALSARKYRKIAINPNEYYGRSVMTAFHGMTSDDFYGIPSSCYALFSAANDYKDQYFDSYNSGVRTNDDEFYTENYSMLAPLCVREIRPDFFLIFKVDDGAHKLQSDAEKIKYFFEKGTLVRSFDMRDGTNVGKCIRGIYEHAKEHAGDAYYAYDDENYNTFTGISLDRGVVTSAYETAKNIYLNCSSQVALNNWMTEGFERNRLISKDIVNLEFMFNDTTEHLFSINTYFGIYVRLNEDGAFTCIGSDGNIYTFSEGAPSQFNPSDSPSTIYGFADETSFTRTYTCVSDATDHKLDGYISDGINPSRNIARPRVYDTVDAESYMTIKLDEPFKVGDHFRLIDRAARATYEIMISNAGDDGEFSELTFNRYDVGAEAISIQRLSISRTCTSTAERDVAALCAAIRRFRDCPFSVCCVNGDEFSITSSSSDSYIERVCSISGFTSAQRLIMSTYRDDTMQVFGCIYPERTYLRTSAIDSEDADTAIFYPIDVMAVGDRIAYIVKFADLSGCIEIDDTLTPDILTGDIVYQTEGGAYVMFDKIEITSMSNGVCGNLVESSTETYKIKSTDLIRSIVYAPDAKLRSDMIYLYNTHKICPGICSIFPLKDIYTDVIDNMSENSLVYGSSTPVSATKGEYASSDNCFGIAVLGSSEENLKDYIDISHTFDRLSEGSEMKLKDFADSIRSVSGKNAMASSPLTAQSICKWKFTGTDARGMDMRLMFKHQNSLTNDPADGYLDSRITSYFIVPDAVQVSNSGWDLKEWDKLIQNNIGFISSGSSDGTAKYISNAINGTVQGESSSSIRDYIINGSGSIDDLIYGSGNIDDKYSSVYVQGDDSVMFISGGVKIRLMSSNKTILNMTKYNGYRAIFVTSSSSNCDHNMQYETIIDETERKIIVIWYVNSEITIGSTPATPNVIHLPYEHTMSESTVSADKLSIPFDGNVNGNILAVAMECTPKSKVSYTSDDAIMCIACHASIGSDAITADSSTTDTSTAESYVNGAKSLKITADTLNLSNTSYYQKSDLYAIVNPADCSIPVPGIGNAFDGGSSIYVKTANGTKDYSNISGLFSISKIDTYKFRGITPTESYYMTHGFTLPSYIEPVTRDVFKFNFSDPVASSAFGMNLSGCNTSISDVSRLAQLWIKKTIDQENVAKIGTTSNGYIYVDSLNNVSIMTDMWNNDIYHKYDYYTDEKSSVLGMSVGYEQNMFLASRGINLNGIEGNEIVISEWKDTYSDGEVLKLNITESLVNIIMTSPGFIGSWGNSNSNETASYKIRYIKNSILNNIDITNQNTFSVYRLDGASTEMEFDDYDARFSEGKLDNIKNELRSENGTYYMYIYPDEMGTYAAKMTINL